MKLNLGCGNDIRDGYINVDYFIKNNPLVVQKDFRDLSWIDSKQPIDEILAIDIIQYVRYTDISNVLAGWISKIEKGGSLYISAPDYDLIANMIKYNRLNIDTINNLLFGPPNPNNIYNYSVYNLYNITELLKNLGCSILESGYSGGSFFVSATKN
jgi:hypothetical protein